MENNEVKTAEETAQNDVGVQEPSIDYKAEYEKMKRLKDQYSKESADWKSKYNSTLSDVEKERLANEEREAHYRELERNYNLGQLSMGLSESISDKDVVNSIANKMLDGDNKGAIEEFNKFIKANNENLSKQIREQLLKNNPTPPPTSTTNNGGVSRKDFDKMSYAERVAFKEKNPETYKKYTE